MKVNDVKTLIDLTLQGIGIVQLHHYTVSNHLKSGRLQELFPDLTRRDVPIFVVLPPRKYTPSKVRAFVDFIDENIHTG